MKQSVDQNSITYRSKHASVSINKSADEVYVYASNPVHMPAWAKGFVKSIHRKGNDWVAETPIGNVTIRCAEPNPWGVLDHTVILASGEAILNPMRVFQNHDGCEVTFTIYWLPGRTEVEFQEDAAVVQADLERLREVMEA